ncbi:hypothetical protein EDB83DRAFT_2379619 [Lactarius deliciosus]|nr:hypothetical protein EDB83DRAFT_2379619 [Lactarius deliciosus]
MSGEVTSTALDQLYRCLTGWRLTSVRTARAPAAWRPACWLTGAHKDIAVASAALIFYDWALTGADELGFLWRRERITYARVLFALARYPALACAVVDLLPPTVKLDKVTTCLRLVTVLCSELILATRTWAIWERSRRMLVFLAVLATACAATAIVIIERDIVTTVVAPSAAPTIQGVQQCQVLTSAVKHAWIVPYLVVMVFEAVVLALTVYKIVGYYRGIPKQLRSKLFDVLWVDGVMYFVFMLREPTYPSDMLDLSGVHRCAHSPGYSERRIGATSPGVPIPDDHSSRLADGPKGSAIASWRYTVSLRTYLASAKVIVLPLDSRRSCTASSRHGLCYTWWRFQSRISLIRGLR